MQSTRWKCTEEAKYKKVQDSAYDVQSAWSRNCGAWVWEIVLKGSDQISKISFKCYKEEFEVYVVRNWV